MRSFVVYWLPLLLWMGLIFVVSAQPSLPQYENGLVDWFLKKIAHVVEYGILAWLWWRALRYTFDDKLVLVCMAFAVTVLYAITDEYHQTFVSGRHGQISDVFIDLVGAIGGLVIAGAINAKFLAAKDGS